jgi:histidine triad (HIT) family protein
LILLQSSGFGFIIARDGPPTRRTGHHGRVPAACLFCEIAAGRMPADLVYEDETFIAFLDHRPLFPGHSLLIPRKHVETLPDLPTADTGPLFERARLLCSAVQEAMSAHGTFVAVNNRVSQSVPHLHVHIVPRREKDGLRGFFWPRMKYESDSKRESVKESIREMVAKLRKG